MSRCVFLAGASGVIGRRLAPLLIADGWRVVGTTRSAEKAASLRQAGVEPVVVDVFDAPALRDAVEQAQPSVVIHQVTDLPPGLDPARMDEGRARNARLRDRGTRHLVAAALYAGCERLIAQSIGFVYARGPTPHPEDDPLDLDAPGSASVTARGITSLERQVLDAPFQGIVLRYGRIYGPGTGFDRPAGPVPVHVDAAAHAARLATTRGAPGIYNIADDDGEITSRKAADQLGWSADFRARPDQPNA